MEQYAEKLESALLLGLSLLTVFLSVLTTILSNRSIEKNYLNEFRKYSNRNNLIGQKKNRFDVISIYRYLKIIVLYFFMSSIASLFLNFIGHNDFVISMVFVIYIAAGYIAFTRVKKTIIHILVSYAQTEEPFDLWFHIQKYQSFLGY